MARSDVPGFPAAVLVAYVQANSGGQRPSEDALKEYLGSRMPYYMVPKFFVFMEEWPLNPSNKVPYLVREGRTVRPSCG